MEFGGAAGWGSSAARGTLGCVWLQGAVGGRVCSLVGMSQL